jgi:hypothetical protein
MKRFKQFLENAKPLSQDEWEEEVFGVELSEVLKQVDGRWALVSKKTGKPLAYYKGEGKPSDEWVADQERRIQYFKQKG